MMTETVETIEVADEVVDRAEISDGKAVVEYTRTERELADLRRRFEGVVFDCTKPADDRAARAARLELVTLRTSLEKRRKEFKAPVLEAGRQIDSKAARITEQIVALETPIDEAIKAEERRKEAARQERERKEAERVAAHRAAIEEVRRAAVVVAGVPSATIAELITATEAWDAGEERFQEFADEAAAAKHTTLQALALMYADTLQREQEAARLAAERAALERQREFDARISRIRNLPATVAGRTSLAIKTAISALEQLTFSAWGDYQAPAEQARAEALGIMRDAYGAAVVREEEAADLARQREAQEAEARRLAAEREALEASQRAQQETTPPADAGGTPPAVAAGADAAPPAAGEPENPAQQREAGLHTQSGDLPADAPAPGDAPASCASNAAEQAPAAPSGEVDPAARASTSAAESEKPTIKLGDILASIDANGGVKFTRQYIEEVHGIFGKRDGAAWLYTKAQRRALLLSIAHTLTEVAA